MSKVRRIKLAKVLVNIYLILAEIIIILFAGFISYTVQRYEIGVWSILPVLLFGTFVYVNHVYMKRYVRVSTLLAFEVPVLTALFYLIVWN